MKSPKTLYILIVIFCVFAIIAGIYAQFIEGGASKNNISKDNEEQSNTVVGKSAEVIKEEFDDLFTGVLNLNGYDTTGIARMNKSKEIVYSAYDITEITDSFEIRIRVPAFNISNEIASTFNSITQITFLNKVQDIVQNATKENKIIYSVDYTGFINGNILSVAIKSTLKEGDSAQRVMIQTYNYNLSTNQKAMLTDIVTMKALNKEDVNKKIMEVVKEADDEAKAVQSMGYNEVFSRDLTSSIYTVDDAGTYLLGPDEKLYIIYPYGNQNFTSEMDIVLFE